jgi:hypothetical protein
MWRMRIMMRWRLERWINGAINNSAKVNGKDITVGIFTNISLNQVNIKVGSLYGGYDVL